MNDRARENEGTPREIVWGLWRELGSVEAIATVTGCPRPLVVWALEESGVVALEEGVAADA